MTVNPIDLQKCLSGMDYPADKEAVLAQAKKNGADEEITKALKALPDQEYDSPAAVNKAVAQGT
ncbi:DUF2795 domain-containing protein [Streptomyces sp. NPDC006261]|uniref:DUF2795 domain-containing protein n=1 Tax=Streptomyces sp. NPDC006261 TaxID=3156739 RepID=UPI0033A0BE36